MLYLPITIRRDGVTAEDVSPGLLDSAGFEFLFDALEVVQNFGNIKMPFHAFIPRIHELRPE